MGGYEEVRVGSMYGVRYGMEFGMDVMCGVGWVQCMGMSSG